MQPARLYLAANLLVACASCTALIDHQRTTPATATKPASVQTTRLAFLFGSDADALTMPGGWSVTGLKNSNAVGKVATGLVAKTGLEVGGELIKPLSKSAGKAIETLAK